MRFPVFARTPPRIAGLLSATASACMGAASALAVAGGARSGADAVGAPAAEAERLARETAVAAGEMLGGGLDRSDVLAMAEGLRATAERLAEAGAALEHVDPSAGPWPELTGVIRDCARALAGALERLDGPGRERDALLERCEELHREGRSRVRAARAQLLTAGGDPLAAITGAEAVERLDRALRACRRAAGAVQGVVVKHA